MNISKKDRDNLIKILQEGEDVSEKYQDILFAREQAQKEYELTYAGKTREEDIIADTLAAPLQDVRTFNTDNKFKDGWVNKLIFGDNLMALKNLYEDSNVKGKVKLIYIDPPFATKQDFMKDEEKAYRDKIVGAKFLEFTRKRIVLLKGLMADGASIFVHLDWKKGHYIKVLMDELFGENYFKNEIIWHYQAGTGPADSFARKHDNILFYIKNGNNTFNQIRLFIKDESIYPLIDKDGRKYRMSGNDNATRYYADEGRKADDVWTWIDRKENNIGQVFHALPEFTGYPTQKPESLLNRIIKATTNEGDLVIDAFAGAGTTLAVAEKLRRRWIGIDCGKLSIYTMQKRMLNLREEIGNRGKLLKAKTFTLYNAGLYDWAEVKKLDFGHYRDFVLRLFQVREEKHSVSGVEIDGYIGNENVYLWNHSIVKKARLDLDFIKSLHSALSGRGGDMFYVIAPTNAFVFYEDEIRLGDTLYKILRVPQSIMVELLKKGGQTMLQPTKEQDVNDVIDAVGFDFIQVPEIETEYKINSKKECKIKIKKFRSRTIGKGPEEFENYETLSMVMVDYNYNGRVFDLDDVFYAENLKPNFEVLFDSIKLGKQMMVIYLDIYGNEKKEILSLKDFKK